MSVLRIAIVQKLKETSAVTALATGGIWAKAAPEDAATYPLVVVSFQDPPAGSRVFQEVAYEEATLLVKAIDLSPSSATAGEIAAAIRTALDGAASLTITGYTLISLVWLSDLDFVEEAEEGTYQHEGGFYQLTARKS